MKQSDMLITVQSNLII